LLNLKLKGLENFFYILEAITQSFWICWFFACASHFGKVEVLIFLYFGKSKENTNFGKDKTKNIKTSKIKL